MNRNGVSHGEKNGNPYEILHDPVLVKYKTYLMLLVQNAIRFIPKSDRLELGENVREHKAKRLGVDFGFFMEKPPKWGF